MIKLDKDKIIPSAVDEDDAVKEDAQLQEEVAGSTQSIKDEPPPEQ